MEEKAPQIEAFQIEEGRIEKKIIKVTEREEQCQTSLIYWELYGILPFRDFK